MPPTVVKSLSRLSRNKILDLCESWTKSPHCEPYLLTNRDIREVDEEDYLYEPAASRSDLRRLYVAQKENHCIPSSSLYSPAPKHINESSTSSWSKKDLIDRVVDGDWRRGLSYEQLAAIDFAALEESDTALRWSALKLVPLTQDNDNVSIRPVKRRRITEDNTTTMSESRVLPLPLHYPQTTPTEFVRNLKAHVAPLVKAHVHLHRLAAHNLSIVRLCIVPDTPFAPLSTNVPRNERAALDGSRVLFVALPDSCPYVYVSISGVASASLERSRGKTDGGSSRGGAKAQAVQRKVDAAATKRIVLEAIPKALSRPQQRWSLQSTNLTARSLRAMTLLRGNCKPGVSGGVFSRLCSSSQSKQDNDQRKSSLRQTSDAGEDQQKEEASEHAKWIERRFGVMHCGNMAKLDRVQFRIKNILLQRSSTCKRKRDADKEQNLHSGLAPITITFAGSDVFAGLKELATTYPEFVDLDRLPSVLTGEEGKSVVTL